MIVMASRWLTLAASTMSRGIPLQQMMLGIDSILGLRVQGSSFDAAMMLLSAKHVLLVTAADCEPCISP